MVSRSVPSTSTTDFSAYARYYDDLAVYNAAYCIGMSIMLEGDFSLISADGEDDSSRGARRDARSGNQYYGFAS
jgi:hypothetical protein